MNSGRPPFFYGRRRTASVSGTKSWTSLFLVAGPCVLEHDRLNFEIADRLAEIGARLDVPITFKASFDKANRSSVGSPRGPGLDDGLAALARVRERSGLPVLTDIHHPEQAARAAAVVDALQIPAFLCRQTDLLQAAGATGRPVSVKKGQWMAPGDMGAAVKKLRSAGAADVAVTERGSAFGYGRWVVDMRSFALMREATGCPTLFDASHAVQLPGGLGSSSGGEPEHIGRLAAAAVAAGADGLFIEVHPDPGAAPSDGSNMLPLDELERVLEQSLRVREAVAA
ncbi:3-deoxy-8-phosphooctulonate synthase [Candidatus Palauibacter sp.]|uniref:3-deoxy-8-phosphooctulonate synthase n=1 Tax=Candidatus Palauibacter sp. TaxID=3101350 RepID=UPI003B02E144